MKLIHSKSHLSPEPHLRIIPYYLGHLFIYLGLVIVILVIGWLLLKTQRIYTTYRTTSQHLARIEAVASARPAPELAELAESWRGLATGLAQIQQEARPFVPLSRYLGWLPRYGGDLEAAPTLLAAGEDVGQAGLVLVETLSPVLAAEADPATSGSLMPAVVARLSQSSAALRQAETRLRQHQAALARLDEARLSPGLAQRLKQLQHYLPSLISALHLSRELPLLLGAESPRTYLILTQNSDELRPAGGYITAAGHVVFDRGDIVEFVMQDSYAVDRLSEAYPRPPDPLEQYMAADYWLLRDASWSPDFPTAARTASELYELGQEVSAAGVVALDQQALPYLLRAIGPLQVEGERVTADNVIKLMRLHWAPQPGQALDGAWWSQRKSFMLALADRIRHTFEQEPGTIDYPALARALAQALAEKHMLIYLAEPAWEDFLSEKNWSGALRPVEGDYLLVVDANVGFNKASAVVQRQLSYRIALANDGSARAEASLSYKHPAPKRAAPCSREIRYDPVYEQNMARCYWNYLRLVVPATAELIRGPKVRVDGRYLLRGQSTTGEIAVEAVGSDKVGWGQLFLLAPQAAMTLDYVYTLPAGTARFAGDHWEYQLDLQKQPGTLAPPVEVVVTLPSGADYLDSQPPPTRRQGATITYVTDLQTDREINLSYLLP